MFAGQVVQDLKCFISCSGEIVAIFNSEAILSVIKIDGLNIGVVYQKAFAKYIGASCLPLNLAVE